MDAGQKKEYQRDMLPNLILLTLLLLSLFLFSGCGARIQGTEQRTTHVIRIATDYREEHLGYQQLQMFAQNVLEKSNGTMEVRLYQTGEWSDASYFAEYIDAGALEMACIPTEQAAVLQPAYALYEQPYLFSNLQSVKNYVTGSAAQTALQQLPQEYYGVGMVTDGYCYFTSDTLQLLSYGTVKHLAEIHELGDTPIYDVQAVYRLHPLIASQRWWEALTEEEQGWIQESFQEALESIFIHQEEIAPQRLIESGAVVQQALPAELAGYTERWMNQRESYFASHSDAITAHWRLMVTAPIIGEET